MNKLNERAAMMLSDVRDKSPLVHNITNFVVMNSTANALLAVGASPVMAHAINEVEEMVAFAGALVLNIGTLTDKWVESMIVAGKKANELGVPVVLDPVGAGATGLRTASCLEILNEVEVSVIRGNASEILAFAGGSEATKGVDSIHDAEDAAAVMPALANEFGSTIATTGVVDIVTDGDKTYRIEGGDRLMRSVTGGGCAATALVGAFLAVEKDRAFAATAALAYYGLVCRLAAKGAPGPGTFWESVIDKLYSLTPQELKNADTISVA